MAWNVNYSLVANSHFSLLHEHVMSAPSSSVSAIPSVQCVAEGVPRFHVPAVAEDQNWALAATVEAAGGVEAEIRAFLDAQLETGDVVLDLSPGFGFVALSATTAPNGMPAVFVAGVSDDRAQQLQDAAADAGGWIDTLSDDELANLVATLDARLESGGKVFVHTVAANVPFVCDALRGMIDDGRLLAICVSDAFDAAEWTEASTALTAAGMTPCEMVERDGEAMVLPVVGAPTAPVIALPASLAAVVEVEPEPTDIYGAARHVDAAPDGRWNATRDGLTFIAPYARTGYGIAASQLLRALQQKQVPVAFFPIGAVDQALIENPLLDQALRLQGAYRTDVPSVRFSQQFDLALHAGRGRHVAYTTFELDQLTENERHHLRNQDAICVASEWGRQVCLDNDITGVPIHVVPHGVDRLVFHEHVTPSTRWDETVFMQIGKLETRKGQLEMLRAFEAAFAPTDRVRLVISCRNPFMSRAEFDAMLAPFRKSPMASRVTILTAEMPTLQEVAALMAGADCGVFPSRAEGWNLEALEMLSMGKPIIATSYSAHTEYLNRDNARLITIDSLEQARSDRGELPGRWAAWGASQHEQLVEHLRDVHTRKQQGRLARNDAGMRTATRYSWANAADCLLRALDAIV